MSYTALYRKWRPDEFEEVKGQEHVVTTLKNQITHDRIGHAYLFCGTRGTGKTTVAKLFAKAVNCEHPKEDGSPCNECETCKAISAGNSLNVIEIDAASNNGVDNIRDIRDEVQYSPTSGKYKVYIIDEVHMLSIGAFNALLKTLEEPPSYVIFILATTESHKIPITILSRCQRYDFRRISLETIYQRLADLLQRENIQAEEKAVRYVAKVADGSMRDALSLLDQCISFYLGQTLTYENVLEVLGAVDVDIFNKLMKCMIESDTMAALDVIEEIVWQGRELSQFTIDFTWYMRNLLLIKVSDRVNDQLDISADNLESMQAMAKELDLNQLMRYIRICSELSGQIRYATQKRVTLELAIIKMTTPAMEVSEDALLDRIRVLEDKLEKVGTVSEEHILHMISRVSPVTTQVATNQEETSISDEDRDAIVEKHLTPAEYEDMAMIMDSIEQIKHNPELGKIVGAGTLTMLNSARINLGADNKSLVLSVSESDDMAYKQLSKKEIIISIQHAIGEVTGKEVGITCSKKDSLVEKDIHTVDLSNVHFKVEIQ